MISDQRYSEAYIWVWLPGETGPVVAGRLAPEGDRLVFNYGKSYLERAESIPLYLPELPLQPGVLPLAPGLSMPSCIRDAAPDAWGRRIIINRRFGRRSAKIDVGQLDELTYLLESGSDRIGALDFQQSAKIYAPRDAQTATLQELMTGAERIEKGVPLTPALEQALLGGSSLGGARPKAMIIERDRKYIAKFSSQSDITNVVKGEYVTMRLAAMIGLDVAPVRLVRVAKRDVLLIERFDREPEGAGWTRHMMVSALTLLGLDEMMGRYASYEDLAEIIRHRFAEPVEALRELYGRLVFNILCGNTDDHARNHAAFWDGTTLTLTPGYDICPQARTGGEASQAMLIAGDNRMSRLSVCLEAAPAFLLGRIEAEAIICAQVAAIHEHWDAACDDAKLTKVDRNTMWRRQFLNPYAFIDADFVGTDKPA